MNFEKFKNDLAGYPPEKIIFVGLGNETRGDDYAGILFLNELQRQHMFTGSRFINAGTNPENHLLQLTENDAEVIVFIDAVEADGSRGEIVWLESSRIDLIAVSTHSFSIKIVEQFIVAARPMEFRYLGITAVSYGYGKLVSREVMNSITEFFKAR